MVLIVWLTVYQRLRELVDSCRTFHSSYSTSSLNSSELSRTHIHYSLSSANSRSESTGVETESV